VTAWQAWLIGGVPALVIAAIAFVGRSPWRSLLGYVALAVGFGILATADRASAAAFAVLIALVFATGRGGRMETQPPEPPNWAASPTGEA
jgi:quinol-cytochrome oxidoreductase complex cytochrome b subunit